jgi:hypothetical protein
MNDSANRSEYIKAKNMDTYIKAKMAKVLSSLQTGFKWVKIGSCSLLVFLILYVCFVTHIEPTEAGIGRNWFSGKLTLLDRSGWHVTPPWVWVSKVSTTPMKVSVSTASRAYNYKLVQFQKEYFKEFIETEGWYFYWWYNRLSFNIGYSHDEEYRGFRDVLRGYAYSAKDYPFIKTLNEYE